MEELLDLCLVVVRVRAETEEAHLPAQIRRADDVTVRRPFRFRVGYGTRNIDILLNERAQTRVRHMGGIDNEAYIVLKMFNGSTVDDVPNH